ncbi:MAG: hypothetical protein ABJB34_05335 [Acidobacteriota bacterium]
MYLPQPPKKTSRSWIWVLAIFAILTLVCGGGLVGFFIYVASIANTGTANKAVNNTWAKKAITPSPGASPTVNAASTSDVQEIDLSEWVKGPTEWLETKMEGGEFFMTSKQKDYYYVLVAKDEDAPGATGARVTVRNPDGEDVSMGYGLVFHSDTTPLTNDYAFLIDTKRKKYRVVRHEDSREKTISAWTSSNFIKDGNDPNLLEARDSGDNIELYLNGQLTSTIANKQGPRAGVPGLYVGDGGRIAFRKLEIVK